MLAALLTLAQILAIVGIISAVLAIAGAVTLGIRGNVLKSTNEMLKKALDDEREEREATEARCKRMIDILHQEIMALQNRIDQLEEGRGHER